MYFTAVLVQVMFTGGKICVCQVDIEKASLFIPNVFLLL